MKLPVFKDNNEILSSPQNAKKLYTIRAEELKKTDGPIGLSTWIYIDNWNYNYGTEKPIIESDNPFFPEITLGAFKNDIEISVKTAATDAATLESLVSDIYTGSDSLSCEDGIIYDSAGSILVADNGVTNIPCGENQTIKIENINIQKWVNILVTFNNRTLDVYMNGKLIKSKPFNNVILTGELNDDISITPGGGFGGFISKVQYFPYFITPAKAWSIYRSGFGDAFESALNKFNLSVSFYEDQVEKKKFYVF
tara:strand:- start:5346 stop:6104 length:759 start_codon:yes stop_codon:yes gene_type:complete